MDLNDKVAFAAKYLNDQLLEKKLEKLADESREKGDLQGILLTGLFCFPREILCTIEMTKRFETKWM